MKFAIVGATGQIGHVLTEVLVKKGHTVKAIGRDGKKLSALQKIGALSFHAEATDARELLKVFHGMDGVFSLLPPGYGADDFGAFQDQVGEAIVGAIQHARIRHVVNLSSFGGELDSGTGPVRGLHRHEDRLNALQSVNIVHLRCAYFMQNFYWAIPAINKIGVHASPILADIPMEMVSTDDIGLKAASLLDRLDFKGHSVFDFTGPGALTMQQATTVLGNSIGRPDLKYVAVSFDDAKKGMIASGMKPDIVDLMLEMNRAFNERKIHPTQELTAEHRGRISLVDFARTGFAHVYGAVSRAA